jgi:uncharacterized membrane protein
MRAYAILFLLFLVAGACSAQGQATLQGFVRDGNTGNSMPGIKVDVYTSEDHINIVASTRTDEEGFYSVGVAPNKYYDVYLRVGDVSPNQRTNEDVEAGGVYTLNFNIAAESSYSSSVVEKYGFGIVVVVAVLILLIILIDQLILRRPKTPGLKELRRERDHLQEMIDLAKNKYHKREIDEESFREIIKDKQERLIELESKIRELEGK